MTCWRWRRIDPDRQALLGALAAAVEHARAEQQNNRSDGVVPCSHPPPAEPLLAPAETLPEGACFQVWPGDGEEPFEGDDYPWRFGMVLGVAWWTDFLGRRHWLIESGRCGVGSGDSSFLSFSDTPRRHPALRELGLPSRHPLALIYPEHAGWWRRRGESREWLVCCSCGECGSLGELAWTGERCGPCFDRLLDNEPVAQRLPLPPRAPFVFDRAGRLIAPLDGGLKEFAAWGPPWSSAQPAWHCRVGLPISSIGGLVLACSGERAALVARGSLGLVDTSNGQILTIHDETWLGLFHLHHLAFAGPTGELLAGLTRHHQETNRVVRVWEWRKGTATGLKYELRGPYTNLAVTSDGQGLLLGGWSDTIEWRDSFTGRLLRRLRLPKHDLIGCVAVTPEGDVIAAGRHRPVDWRPTGVPSSWQEAVEFGWPPVFSRTLGRWRVMPLRPASFLERMASRLLGPDPDEPAVRSAAGPYHFYSENYPECLAVSPDGRLLAAWTATGVSLHDAHSLELLADFDRGCPISGLAFSPDGATLAVAAETLMLWPVGGLLR
jgi:hypothetical protein